MSKVQDGTTIARALQSVAADTETADAAVRERIAQFRDDDNASMMGGWT